MREDKATGWGRAEPKGLSGRNILPRVHAPLQTFVVAMAVMCYLAAMATGGLLMTRQAIAEWTAGITSEATAQVMPGEGGADDLASRVKRAAEVLRAAPGVRAVRVLDESGNRALLEPWLGKSGLLEDLPLPRLIAVELDREAPANIAELNKRLREKVKGVRLDAHGRWVAELSSLARTVSWLGFGVLAVIAVASAVLVAYASRTALEANHETIKVLHLVGAKDRFIARHVERRFLRAGFFAALVGVSAAWATYGLLALPDFFSALPNPIAQAARELLFGPWGEVYRHYAAMLVIVIVATLISLVSARMAVMRLLHGMFR